MEVIFIETKDELAEFKKQIRKNRLFLFCIPTSTTSHPRASSVSVLFAKVLFSNTTFVLPFDHVDSISELLIDDVSEIINKSTHKNFVFDKKSFCQMMNVCNTYDVNILSYIINQEIIDIDANVTSAHSFFSQRYSKCNALNSIIPINKHLEKFKMLYSFVEELADNHFNLIKMDSFNKLNNIIVDTLTEIESNGICVDEEVFLKTFGTQNKHLIHDGMVYSQYNIFTSTGRPSNKFGGINFAALNKSDDSRMSFVSRFEENGKLVDIDFTAFHPHLIATLIRYELEEGVDIYRYLGEYYFKTNNLSDDDVAKSKQLTFRQLYGGVENKYKDIPYFKKWNDYVNQRYAFFKQNGYVETPVYNRRIKFGNDIDPNKMANYILQAFETEIGVSTANRINQYINENCLKSKLILYTYDSILIDFHKDDGKENLINIKNLMIDKKFPVKIKIGDNYKQLKRINL